MEKKRKAKETGEKKNTPIRLRDFKVELDRWGKNPNGYNCKANFTHGKNSFEIELGQEIGEMILTMCRGKIMEASADAVEMLTMQAEMQIEKI